MPTRIEQLNTTELHAAITQERNQLLALQESVGEWQQKVDQLEREVAEQGAGGGVDNTEAAPPQDGGQEWKIRYDSQVEMNQQLEGQVTQLKEKVRETREQLKSTNAGGGYLDQFKGASGKKMMIKLQREKKDLESQLRDYEWRLDQEGTKYHKVDEQRTKLYKDMKGRRRRDSIGQNSLQPLSYQSDGIQPGALTMTFDDWRQKNSDGRRGSVSDRRGSLSKAPKPRVIDPSKGPVNPNAVRNLPSLSEG